MKESFRRVAARASVLVGSAGMFALAIAAVLVWLITGPLFDFSDTWQLIINTGTTIVTFLMVFLIQNTQNRDGRAIQLKLDELIRAHKGARMRYVGLEEFTDAEIADIEAEIRSIANHPASKRALAKLHDRLTHETQQRQTNNKNSGSSLPARQNTGLQPTLRNRTANQKVSHHTATNSASLNKQTAQNQPANLQRQSTQRTPVKSSRPTPTLHPMRRRVSG